MDVLRWKSAKKQLQKHGSLSLVNASGPTRQSLFNASRQLVENSRPRRMISTSLCLASLQTPLQQRSPLALSCICLHLRDRPDRISDTGARIQSRSTLRAAPLNPCPTSALPPVSIRYSHHPVNSPSSSSRELWPRNETSLSLLSMQ